MDTNSYSLPHGLYAELTDGASALTVYSEELQDYDTYQLEGGEWILKFDALSSTLLPAGEIWEDKEFSRWADGMKTQTPQ
tara:strand:- start:9 stop:248 length:240 start_codon:yes stop_codon:yes gene_type:complete